MEKLSEIQVQMLRTNIRCAEILATNQLVLDSLENTINDIRQQALQSQELINRNN